MEDLGHKYPNRITALPLQPLITAPGDYAIRKFPCDWFYPDSSARGSAWR
jgi:hypothetical protein